MNREELEKMFNEKLNELTMDYDDNGNPLLYMRENDLNRFIFDTIIPEVLKSVIPNKINTELSTGFGNNICIEKIKQKAKKLYGIDL